MSATATTAQPTTLEQKPLQKMTLEQETNPWEAQAFAMAVALHKSYRKGQVAIPVLRNVNFSVKRGEFVSSIGASGSGKSTLLHLLGTLDGPDAGEIHFDGERVDNLPAQRRDRLRNRQLGMIFQFYHLLPELDTLENVLAPLMIAESALGYFRNRKKHVAAAKELLSMVGLSHRLKHRPRELSGGEMQPAAIARAVPSFGARMNTLPLSAAAADVRLASARPLAVLKSCSSTSSVILPSRKSSPLPLPISSLDES